MEWLKEWWSLFVAIIGIAVSWGSMNTKIKHQDEQIDELRKKQDTTEQLLQDINTSLTELNVKVGLLVSGQIKTKEE